MSVLERLKDHWRAKGLKGLADHPAEIGPMLKTQMSDIVALAEAVDAELTHKEDLKPEKEIPDGCCHYGT